MNHTQLYIPKKCKVGFNLRTDTYTGKLGYIIYNDGKVWRKEKSWEGWIKRPGDRLYEWDPITRKNIEGVYGDDIAPIEFDNVPTEGFVLNKKVGGVSSGWDHRQTYSRVYDPRGWEFEITVPNLLYILQECSSFKGKGLEGAFVYSWDGKDLVLLPATSPDYLRCEEYTNLQSVKFSKKNLFEGHTYLTNKQEKLLYLGYYPVIDNDWYNRAPGENTDYGQKMESKHVFQKEGKNVPDYEFLTSFSRLKLKLSEDIDPDFANKLDHFLNRTPYASEADHLEVVPFSESFISDELDRRYEPNIYMFGTIRTKSDREKLEKRVKREGTTYEVYTTFTTDTGSYYWNRHKTEKRSEGFFTLDELKENYGMLVRVYKNGLKKEL